MQPKPQRAAVALHRIVGPMKCETENRVTDAMNGVPQTDSEQPQAPNLPSARPKIMETIEYVPFMTYTEKGEVCIKYYVPKDWIDCGE